jgi:hypothetical protein
MVPFAGNAMLNVALFSPVTVKGAGENVVPNNPTPPECCLGPLVGTVTVPAVVDRVTVPKFRGVASVFSMVIGAITLASIPILLAVDDI